MASPSTDIDARTVGSEEPQIFMGRKVVPLVEYPFRVVAPVAAGEWSTDITECLEDTDILCCSLFCPCIQAGRNIEIISEGKTDAITGSFLSLISIFWCFYTCGYRKKLREKFLLPPKPFGDCQTHFFLPFCALSQEARELKIRGWDPSRGYAGNIQDCTEIGVAPSTLTMNK